MPSPRSQAESRPSSAASGSLSTSTRGSGAGSARQGRASSGSSAAKGARRGTVGAGATLTPSRLRRQHGLHPRRGGQQRAVVTGQRLQRDTDRQAGRGGGR